MVSVWHNLLLSKKSLTSRFLEFYLGLFALFLDKIDLILGMPIKHELRLW
jgi:hypothetical protein